MSTSNSPQIVAPEPAKRDLPWSSLRGSERVSTPPAYKSDPKYKKYTQQVEKCLNSFDSVHEWADFISFLKQLLKTFQAYEQFKEIPRKLVVAKRLSQCLNPALPTGVHQRALDVYSHILAVLGTEGLHRDLALWSSGLFPFFEYAATSVKPTLLNIFDTYYLPLQSGLRPIMKSFILALLPGLEEETGEYFEKVLSLLDRISGTVSQSYFFQNIWLIMLTMPSARGTSLNFLSRRLPTLKADEDISFIVGRDIGLMIRAFSTALEDDDLLVRRGALDLLLQSLRIDGVAFRRAQHEDRTILMHAASSVVLRRDLSLNRRLYSWLLGPHEDSQRQIEYFKAHALDLLRSTLRDEMFSPLADYSPSRPYKIFVSLLDKWEIGFPLTEVLVYDAFKALKATIEAGSDSGDDLSITASTVYEAVEPQLLWKQMFTAIYNEVALEKSRTEACDMVQYLLVNVHTQDEEIETIHLPIIFAAIAEMLMDHIDRLQGTSILRILSLQQEVLGRISPAVDFLSLPKLSNDLQSAISEGPSSFACAFYGIQSYARPRARSSSNVPLATIIEDLTLLSITGATSLLSTPSDLGQARGILIRSLLLLDLFTLRVDSARSTPLVVSWDPAQWLSVFLRCSDTERVTFNIVDRIISTSVRLHGSNAFQPKLSIGEWSTISTLVTSLLRYLRLPWAAHHSRAVSLVWSLDAIGHRRHVESAISRRMSSRDPTEVEISCEIFGTLWRLTDDDIVPGSRLKVPMMIVLDTLKSGDPTFRRIGETWMRCSLKSYLRVLDPLLFDLSDPSIRRTNATTDLNSKILEGFYYERPFDQRYINHALETLLSVIKFGGQGFTRIARTTPIVRSLYPDLLQRLQSAGVSFAEATYMEVLLYLLLRFLQSEPRPALALTMSPLNVSSQANSIELLQALVSRGEIEFPLLQTIEAAIVKKLYICVHTGRLDLQNKLLHLLHSIISASTSGASMHPGRGSLLLPGGAVDGVPSTGPPDADAETYAVNPLLIQTLLDGISRPTNRPILQHWLDFILMTIPQFQDLLHSCVDPVCDGICRQLWFALNDLRKISIKGEADDDVETTTTDADFIMLLTALERLVLLSFSQVPETHQTDEEYSAPGQESSGLLGYVSNVFSSEAPGVTEEPLASSDYHALHEAVRVLYALWDNLAASTSRLFDISIYSKARNRSRKVLEHLFRAHSTMVLESIIDCWQREPGTIGIFEIVDILASSSQNVVHMLCESISSRNPNVADKSRKSSVLANLSDLTILDFLEHYTERLEGPLALQVWARFLQLIKETVATLREFKVQAYPICFTVLADKVCQTTAVEDRRIRKELQDNYSKLLDLCVLAGRPYDQGSWIRRTPRDTLTVNGGTSSLPRVASDGKLDEKINASSTSLPESIRPAYGSELIEQINLYIASSVLPNLRRFFPEADKVLAACNSIVYNVITPSLKGKARPLDIDSSVVSLFQELTKIGSALKAWRGPVTEALYDNRCFNSTPDAGANWRVMIKSFFDTDKTALTELLGKITTAPSANIFTNREYEMLLRSLNLRRLSYVLLSGEKNHFLVHLPIIQEKLVDTLRNVIAPVVQSEVYLCVRVLLCRLSPHNLSSFWPVILTEMYRLFEQALISLPSDGSEELGLILAACKLLDLLLVLQTEEFQTHQWIFITDTVDAIYRPDDWFPEAMLDRMAEVTNKLPLDENDAQCVLGTAPTPTVDTKSMRRPMLRSLRQIDSIRDLGPFFSSASIASYESVYNSGGNIDWEAVERGLLEDMFDGR
ncbi:uncharacterized protein LAESUDRAFT_757319 [Laetiporus sulphureus 93-53]|uniref:Uncharacterized protein n=1 Tax=Laetiporus sulphureus 93-53 TaxID=1314785 RepID=A0A165F8I8_9APHY|nr:uncharacterized protein LAESUDRAFT_757319 [Laetiporus sulphureus 93-53]KZT08595.1 hypothetical protein LAESUDRAFT_757319 [Laetiporus sulphureus 93-53]